MPATPPEALTVDDVRELADEWDVALRSVKKAPATIEAYRRGLRQYADWCEQTGHAPIVRRSLTAWLAVLAERLQPYTMRSRMTAVRTFARWLADEGEIDASPFERMQQPAVDEKIIQPITEDEIKAMLATCRTTRGTLPERTYVNVRDAAIIAVMFETGLRAGELVGMTVDDVHWRDDPATLLVQRSKTHTGRSVSVSPQTAERIARYVRARRRMPNASADAFWLGTRGRVLGYSGRWAALSKRATEAGIADFHPHKMRHSAAHRWLAKGGSESALMSRAGWRSPQMLHRYTKAQAAERAAAEAKKLNLGEL